MKGDTISDLQSISAAAYLTIRPSTGISRAVHNIYHEGTISVQIYDGTNRLEFISDLAGAGCLAYNVHHITNAIYLTVQNEDGTAKLIGYDSIETEASKITMALESIAAGEYLDIRPDSGDEWILHNIYHQGTISLEYYDGTNKLEFVSSRAGVGVFTYYAFHATRTRRIRVLNEDGSAKLIAYSCFVSK